MVAEFADNLIRLSLTASAAILAVMALRPLIRKVGGPVIAYGLWALVPLAVVMVFLPTPSGGSLIPEVTGPIVSAMAAARPVIDSQLAAAKFVAPVAAVVDFTSILLMLWLTVAGLLLARLVWMEAKLARALSGLRPDPDHGNVFYMEGEGISPMVVGLWKSRIVLPSDFAGRYERDECQLILAHERAHLRARHLPAGALAYMLLIVQWFNPLAHMAMHLFRIDQELACDAMVVAAHPEQKAVYARAMFKTGLSRVSAPLACGWAKGPTNPTRRRIAMLKIVVPSRAQKRLAGLLTVLFVAGGSMVAYAAVPAPGAAGVQRAIINLAPVATFAQNDQAVAPVVPAEPKVKVASLRKPLVTEPVEGAAKPEAKEPPFSFVVPISMTSTEAARAAGLPDEQGYGVLRGAGSESETIWVRCNTPQTPANARCA